MKVEVGQHYRTYQVESIVGEGGLGVVARAVDGDGRVVALKILTAARRAEYHGLHERFLREATVLEALKPVPSVVQIYEHFRDEPTGADVLVMEFVDGQPLSAVPAPTMEQVVEWMGHVCHAIHDVHDHGFVHRDLKPDNLMLTRDPVNPIRLIDFNSAAVATPDTGRLTLAQGTFPHTPAYLAPECFDGIPPDKSADVYALGISFGELLLGRHPLVEGAEPDTPTGWQVLHASVPFPLLAVPGVPPGLTAVLADATAKTRAERIPDAVVLWERLRAVWERIQVAPAPEPVVEAPPPRPRRRWWVHVLVGGMLAALGLFVCMGGSAAYQAWSYAEAARDAELEQAKALAEEQARLAREADARADQLAEEKRQAEEEAKKLADAQATAPAPVPDPDPVYVPQPDPEPQMTRGVSPQPAPVPQPQPQPVPQPVPVPQPPPQPTYPPPQPYPYPQPVPQPTYPYPRPQPRPQPTTRPRPTPRPRPTTRPSPSPRPSPTPRPTPRPAPSPDPDEISVSGPRPATRIPQ